MTSKISFNKLLKEDFRHRLWVPALACVVFFLCVVSVAMCIQSASPHNDFEYVHELVSRNNYMMTFVAIVGATICGLESFAYLFRKQQVDFYHSLPIKREKLFVVRYVNGLLFYAVPALIYTIAIMGATAISGFDISSMAGDIMIGYAQNLLVFLMFYHTAMLASMLCGTVLVAGAGYAVLMIYGSALADLIPSYVTNYFDSYYSFTGGFLTWFNYICPVYWTAKLYDLSLQAYVCSLLLAAVIWVITFRLYLVRPSEAAGKSLAFKKTRSVFRILVVIPASLYVGLFFLEMAMGYENAWAIAGVVISTILLHGIVDVIYDFDVRSALKHKKQLAACILFGLVFVGFFIIDPFRIDSHFPTEASVKEVYMDVSNSFLGDCYDPEADTNENSADYHLKHSVLSSNDLDAFYNMMEYAQSPRTVDEDDSELYCEQAWNMVKIRFVKNKGTSEYRRYYIPESAKETLEQVYACEYYRHSLYPIYNEDYVNAILRCDIYNGDYSSTSSITYNGPLSDKSALQQLIAAYREDLDEQNYETIKKDDDQNQPVYRIDFNFTDTDVTGGYPVYTGFTHTIELLKKMEAE